MRWPAPAKLNLFLRILGRRPDGRHDLQTLFQLLDFGDEVEITPRRDGRIVLRDPPPGLDAENELSIRAARLLRARSGAREGVSIRLLKRIPAGAGLGGGSSDAATTLVVLNRLWKTGLDDRALAALGLALGADVPFFVRGRSGWGEGTGERIRALRLPPLWYLVVHPRLCVADRGGVQRSPFDTGFPLRSQCAAFSRAAASTPLLCWPRRATTASPWYALRHPAVGASIEWLRRRTERAEWARMTGTGAASFGVFRREAEARAAAQALPAAWDGRVAAGIDESPLREGGPSPPT